jgi:hypothetical protein
VVIQPLRLLSTICSVGKEHRRSFGCDRSVEHIVDVSGWSVFRNTIALARSGGANFILSSTGISFLPRFSRSRSHQHSLKGDSIPRINFAYEHRDVNSLIYRSLVEFRT